MTEKKKCKCSGKSVPVPQDSDMPRNLETETMITPDDFGKIHDKDGKVSKKSVEESVVMTNPDVSSMESRG